MTKVLQCTYTASKYHVSQAVCKLRTVGEQERRWTLETGFNVVRSLDRDVAEGEVHREPNPGMDKPVVEQRKARGERGCGPRMRRRRMRIRRRRRRSRCICKPSARRRKSIVSTNPFIIFYLEMYFKSPEKRVTIVAREAGKQWSAMPDSEKAKYIELAERAKRRRWSRR